MCDKYLSSFPVWDLFSHGLTWSFHGGTYSHGLSVVLLSNMSLKVREIPIRHHHLWPGKVVEPKLGWFLLIRTVRKLVDSDNSSPTARTRCHRFPSNSILSETEQMLLRSAAAKDKEAYRNNTASTLLF